MGTGGGGAMWPPPSANLKALIALASEPMGFSSIPTLRAPLRGTSSGRAVSSKLLEHTTCPTSFPALRRAKLLGEQAATTSREPRARELARVLG